MNIKPYPVYFCTFVVLLMLGCTGKDSQKNELLADFQQGFSIDKIPSYNNMTIDTTSMLLAFYPNFKRIDLVCKQMPQPTDTSVIFCCEAAFTGKLLKTFTHENIAGNHVSSGSFFKGYPCCSNTGAFMAYNNTWKFVYDDYATDMVQAADMGGMAFGQLLFIHRGLRMPASISKKTVFRALCERRGKLCVIESRQSVYFPEFIKYLGRYGVTEALYLDMGEGWNHSWYRDNEGMAHDIYPKSHDYCTNWIAFYR